MGLIKRSDADHVARDAVVMNLADLERAGKGLESAAQAEAERIVREATSERDRLLGDAAEVGRAEGDARGYEEGLARGSEEGRAEASAAHGERISGALERWSSVLDEVTSSRKDMLEHARTDVLRLAVIIAQRVIKRSITLDPAVVEAQLEATLGLVALRSALRISVHPEDEARARDALPGLLERFDLAAEHAEVLADERLERGSCVVRTPEGGEFSAEIMGQLDRIVRDLLPDSPRLGLSDSESDEVGDEDDKDLEEAA